jgi:signal transduction histidine kinase
MSRTSLSQFIRHSLAELADEWQRHAATCMPAAEQMNLDQLRNHVRELLVWVADDMESPQTAREQREKSQGYQHRSSTQDTAAEGHAALRVESGFTLEQVVGEFRALRASVLHRRAATLPTLSKVDIDEMTRFNESIDQMLSESVARHTRMVEDALRTADRNKDRFLAMLSHELRNPLNAIALGIETLHRGRGSVKPDVAMMLTRQTRHLKRLLDDLLDLSRIANDRITLNIERIDVRVCITDALTAVDDLMTQKDHEVKLDLPGEAVAVEADPTRITQIIANLLKNAAKYSPMRSTIKVSVNNGKDTVEIRVRDNGRGIAADDIPHLFEPFSLSGGQNPREQAGLGLGLSISQRLANLHAGTLSVHSAGVGAGAEFCLAIPASRP